MQIQLTTRWLYSDYRADGLLPEGRLRWPFSRGGKVTASDVPSEYEHMQDISSHLHRAVSSFGDDRELLVEVRPQRETPEAFARRLLAATEAQLAHAPKHGTLRELESVLQRLAKEGQQK